MMCISFRFILLLYVQAHANVDVQQVYFEIGSARSTTSGFFVIRRLFDRSVFFNDSSLPLTKRFEPLEKANSVSLKKPKRLFLSIPIYALWNRAAEKVSPK